jgi:hypothetical protein
MKITIEATDQIVNIDGAECRRWKGVTEKGIECDVFVRRLRVLALADCSQFDQELIELPEPRLPAIDLRMLI